MSTANPGTHQRQDPADGQVAGVGTDLTTPDMFRPRRGRRRFVVGLVVVVVLVGAGAAVDRLHPYGIDLEHPLGVRPAAKTPASGNGAATALATVARRGLSAQTSLDGTLGYADSHSVVNQARGVITALPGVGKVIGRGQVLYRVDGAPVILLYGSTAAYRTLAAGASASDVSGQDVRQLNANLVALGYAKASQLDADSDEFGSRTTAAVKKLQGHLGMKQTGKLPLGQVVFLPEALRVTAVQAVQGAPAGPGGTILQASSTTRQVTVNLDTSQQAQLEVGDKVTITLPDNATTPGKVTSIGKVASTPRDEQDSPTVEVAITPTKPGETGSLDKAPVQVGVTTDHVDDAVVVPIESLLALASGGYAVEVVTPAGKHQLVPVTLGLFDDDAGLVQVTDTSLVPGQRVVVPST